MSALDYKYVSDLVIRAQANDSDAFAELYAATYQKQYHFACCYLKDEYLAQDALQETYILALKNLTKLKDPDLLIAWLNQINFRVCYNLNKKKMRYEMEMTDFNSDAGNSDMTSSLENSPEEMIIEIDSKEYLMNQILKLPFTEAQVIILKFYQNMKQEDIAFLMDISRSSVKRYLASGLARLKKMLQQGGNFSL
ncbi:MAG: sigma-70 family RNA polymerase sigma factor [Lachnospiraceae bacterium]|nr:sigma-70 family RNA polymerase sigma factor [Lachnospiraceae bacterium]